MSHPVNHIAQRIDGFIKLDPDRVVDMWSYGKTKRIHDIAIQRLFHNSSVERPLILDAGCGNGALYDSLKRNHKHNFELCGFDCSNEAVKHCVATTPVNICSWVTAQDVDQACRLLGKWRFDFGFCLGPFAYRQGQDKWDAFQLLPRLMEVCDHGIGYFMYSSAKNWYHGQVFVRFHPDEVRAQFPMCEVIVHPELISEYGSDSGYIDFDKVLIKW